MYLYVHVNKECILANEAISYFYSGISLVIGVF